MTHILTAKEELAAQVAENPGAWTVEYLASVASDANEEGDSPSQEYIGWAREVLGPDAPQGDFNGDYTGPHWNWMRGAVMAGTPRTPRPPRAVR